MKATTITTIGQLYFCILDNYFSGPVLDDRSLLVPAFAALTQELQRRGLDQPNATLPALSGKNNKWQTRDWTEFSHVYERIVAGLPQDPGVRQAIAEATIRGMIASLNDNHVVWQRGSGTLATNDDLVGIRLSGVEGSGHFDPVASEPLFVMAVDGPAEVAGIRPGDEIVAINEVPPFVNRVPSAGVLKWITEATAGTPLRFTLRRPATEATFTVTVIPAPFQARPRLVESRLVNGNIAYVKMPNFGFGSADRVLAAIAELGKNTSLRGVILDLRGNGGGRDEERSRLLGAFVHDAIVSYWCDVKDRCTANRSDDSVPLLNIPMVALTDRYCASACDSFSSAVKDLHLGALVGTRTNGVVSGPPEGYLLDDGSAVGLPRYHEVAANGEVVNTIGVAPDYYAPMTAADLSFGRDPGLAKAIELLQ